MMIELTKKRAGVCKNNFYDMTIAASASTKQPGQFTQEGVYAPQDLYLYITSAAW